MSDRLTRRRVAWFRDKNPVLRFVVVFGFLTGLFYAIMLGPSCVRAGLLSCELFSARMASAVCNGFGQHTSVVNNVISSNRFSFEIDWGCDGSEPLALFLAAVLAFPAPFRRKIPGILLGVVVLAFVNLVRIVSLFLTGVYLPHTIEWMHTGVWPAAFILLAVVLWALWIQWAMKPCPATPHGPR